MKEDMYIYDFPDQLKYLWVKLNLQIFYLAIKSLILLFKKILKELKLRIKFSILNVFIIILEK